MPWDHNRSGCESEKKTHRAAREPSRRRTLGRGSERERERERLATGRTSMRNTEWHSEGSKDFTLPVEDMGELSPSGSTILEARACSPGRDQNTSGESD